MPSPPPLSVNALCQALPEWLRKRAAKTQPLPGGNSSRLYTVSDSSGFPCCVARLLLHSTVEQAQHELACLQLVSKLSHAAPKPLSTSVHTIALDGIGEDVPLLLLERVGGEPCDAVLSRCEDPTEITETLESCGSLLALLHSRCSAADSTTSIRLVSEGSGGCCDLWKHVDASSSSVHDLPDDAINSRSFYSSRLPEVRMALLDSRLPRGFCHGDAFLDNIVTSKGIASKLVDWEDAAGGAPLIFDLACLAASIAFAHTSESLTRERSANREAAHRVQSMLQGYVRRRQLQQAEVRLLVPAMRAALLCNFHFRAECVGEESADELAQRIKQLESPPYTKAIERAALAVCSSSVIQEDKAEFSAEYERPVHILETRNPVFRWANRVLHPLGRDVKAFAVQASVAVAAVGIAVISYMQSSSGAVTCKRDVR